MCILRAPSLNSMLSLSIGEAMPENVAALVRIEDSERRLIAPQTASNAASDMKLMISRARSPRNDQRLRTGLLTATISLDAGVYEDRGRRLKPQPRTRNGVRISRRPA